MLQTIIICEWDISWVGNTKKSVVEMVLSDVT